MVRRKHSNHRIRILAQQKKGGESDGGGGVASDGLGNRLRLWQLWNLLQDREAKVVVGNDPETFSRSERQKPGHSLLDHGLLAIQREQLLGAFLPA